jgi:hypothetical protein
MFALISSTSHHPSSAAAAAAQLIMLFCYKRKLCRNINGERYW